MKINSALTKGYENTELVRYEEIDKNYPNSVLYKDIQNYEVNGVLKANIKTNEGLLQVYSSQENHVGVVAATRLGKTTQYVIPTILSFAKNKIKHNMVISDPKGELYRLTSQTLRNEGYNVMIINFRDYAHSEYWNPLTDIYNHYQEYLNIEKEVETVQVGDDWKYTFRGFIYDDPEELAEVVRQQGQLALENVYGEVHSLAYMLITTENQKDPHWEDTARLVLEAVIIGLLEDSVDCGKREPVTIDNFSLGSVLSIVENFSERESNSNAFDDNGFFTTRSQRSKAYMMAKNAIFDTARGTRTSIMNSFNTKMAIYKNSNTRMTMSCSSFKLEDLISDRPMAIYLIYRDEIKDSYGVISAFVQQAYAYLISYASNTEKGKLDVPYYFILDEFGNFPKIRDFDTVMSAAGGRNIFFVLVLQSYAQLVHVYEADVAEIIKDNLNVHVFIGSNNPSTLEGFSKECGLYTRLSPKNALVGNNQYIDSYNFETIPLIPKSTLASLKVGECIVTEASSGYVLFSKMERYYMCDQYADLPLTNESNYRSKINPLERKYYYYKKLL